jgi:protein TonB
LRVALALSFLLHLALLATWPGNAAHRCCAVDAEVAELAVQLVDARRLEGRPPPHVVQSSASATQELPVPDPTAGPTPTVADAAPASDQAALAAVTARSRLARQHLAAQLAHYFTYPALARRQGWEGQVLLALTIEPDGHLDNLQVASSSGHAVLDAAALHALSRVGRLVAAGDWLAGTTLDLRLPVIYRLTEH